MKRSAVALCLLVLASSGCAKIREKLGRHTGAASTSSAPSAASSGAPVPVVSAATASSAKLPDGWPSSVPPYPNAVLVSASASPSGRNVMLRTRDSGTKVREYYMDRLAAMKLQTDMTVASSSGPSNVMAFKDGAQMVTVTIATTPTRETSVTLSIVPKP